MKFSQRPGDLATVVSLCCLCSDLMSSSNFLTPILNVFSSAVVLKLERTSESPERLFDPNCQAPSLHSWFNRFQLGSGNLHFKSPSDAATGEAVGVPPKSPFPAVVSGDWQQLIAALFSVFCFCLFSEWVSRPKEITFLGGCRNTTCLTSSNHTHTHTRTHAHTQTHTCMHTHACAHTHTPWQWLFDMATRGQLFCSLFFILCAAIQAHGSV